MAIKLEDWLPHTTDEERVEYERLKRIIDSGEPSDEVPPPYGKLSRLAVDVCRRIGRVG